MMKNLAIASLIAFGTTTVYAEHSDPAVELEHANKTADDKIESVSEDMSAMKAAGKCNADQYSKKAVPKKKATSKKKKTKAELEIEHANKLKSEPDGVAGDMGNMKAQGKCGSK